MIHKYKLGNFCILLDIGSGAVHLIDDLTYDMLDYLQPPLSPDCPKALIASCPAGEPREIEERYQELYELQQAGTLFADDGYAAYRNQMENAPIKAMCLHIAHDCNLRCRYCFASTGDFGGGRKLMPFSTAKKAIDFLLAHSGSRYHLEVDFFGGEPLMNFDVIQKTVSYAREQEAKYHKKFRFTVTTNGILLTDDKIPYLNREMDNIVLSLDGRKEINDHMRPRVDGSGSFDSILPKYQKLVASREDKDYYVRGTFTKYNLDFAEDVFAVHKMGFDQLSIEPVVADPSADWAITEADLPTIFEEYETLANRIIEEKKQGSGMQFFHFMIDLDQGPCAIKRLRGCGCGNEYVAVTPEGDIYPCHQFVGMKDWKMGSVLDDTIDKKKKDFFAHTTIYDKPECQACWAKFYCSGGCNANNYQYAGDVHTPYRLGCEMEKKRLECAIMIQAAMACKGEESKCK